MTCLSYFEQTCTTTVPRPQPISLEQTNSEYPKGALTSFSAFRPSHRHLLRHLRGQVNMKIATNTSPPPTASANFPVSCAQGLSKGVGQTTSGRPYLRDPSRGGARRRSGHCCCASVTLFPTAHSLQSATAHATGCTDGGKEIILVWSRHRKRRCISRSSSRWQLRWRTAGRWHRWRWRRRRRSVT